MFFFPNIYFEGKGFYAEPMDRRYHLRFDIEVDLRLTIKTIGKRHNCRLSLSIQLCYDIEKQKFPPKRNQATDYFLAIYIILLIVLFLT